MRRRKLTLVATLSGFPMALGTVSIAKFAKARGLMDSSWRYKNTERLCPDCGDKPKHEARYLCSCGKTYTHYSKLKWFLKATKQLIQKPKLTKGGGEAEKGIVFVMKAEDFANKYSDATLNEHGLITGDPQTARNVRKLLIAVERLGMVIVVRFQDTYEERVCLLSVSMSNRVILREVIPINLADITETMRVQMEDLTEADITEAQQLVKMLKEADDDTFKVKDYRTLGLADAPLEAPKVQTFKEILAKVQVS